MKTFTQRFEEIQEKANAKIEAICQKEYQLLYEELKQLYPKRDIKFLFGNGTMIVLGFKNTHASDSFGHLDIYGYCDKDFMNRFPDNHPLLRLMKFMDDAVYPSTGHNVCCDCIG